MDIIVQHVMLNNFPGMPLIDCAAAHDTGHVSQYWRGRRPADPDVEPMLVAELSFFLVTTPDSLFCLRPLMHETSPACRPATGASMQAGARLAP